MEVIRLDEGLVLKTSRAEESALRVRIPPLPLMALWWNLVYTLVLGTSAFYGLWVRIPRALLGGCIGAIRLPPTGVPDD